MSTETPADMDDIVQSLAYILSGICIALFLGFCHYHLLRCMVDQKREDSPQEQSTPRTSSTDSSQTSSVTGEDQGHQNGDFLAELRVVDLPPAYNTVVIHRSVSREHSEDSVDLPDAASEPGCQPSYDDAIKMSG